MQIIRLDSEVKMPEWNGRGYYIRSRNMMKLYPQQRLTVPTGIIFNIPEGYCGILLNSGFENMAINVEQTVVGEKELMVFMENKGDSLFHIFKNDCIALLVVFPVLEEECYE